MSTILKWFDGGPWLNLLSFTLALIGLYYSFHFYHRSKREKTPLYWPNSYPLLRKNVTAVNGLKVTLNGAPIENLTVTRIAFWNAGHETIDKSDIAPTDPLRVKCMPGDAPLGSELAFVRRSSNAIRLRADGNAIIIEFDFLDHTDGCIIDVYHSIDATFEVAGTIRGSNAITNAKHAISPLRAPWATSMRMPSEYEGK